MKRILAITLSILLFASSAYAFKPFSYLFTGRWQPAEDPLLIDENGFQDIQNLRKDGKRLRGVAGHTRTTSGVVNATYKYIKNGFHFRKDQPAESHVLIHAANSANTAARIYQNTTAIPGFGDFSATSLHTPASGYGITRFSSGPQGTVIACNGVESQVWGGDEFRTGAFITSTAAVTGATVTGAKDHTLAIRNTSTASGDTVTIAKAGDLVFLVGSTRPLQGLKITVSTVNTGSPSLTGKEWDGSWSSLGNLVDNTAGLKATGTITFDSTVTTSVLKHIEGRILFWYQFELSAGTAVISYVTVDAPWQDLQNIWDLTESIPGKIQTYDGTSYTDYTDEGIVNETDSVIVLDDLDTGHSLLVGFAEPQQGMNIRMLATKENSTGTVLTIKYWTGSAVASVTDQVDGTIESSTSLYKSGVMTWAAVAKGSEFKRSISGEAPLYYYELTFTVKLDAEVEAYYISGIPVPDAIAAYRFPALFQERVFLFNETGGARNRAIYSAFNSPDVYNGPESSELFFGDESEIMAAGVLYNLFASPSGLHQLIVFKRHATYRLLGTGPEDWDLKSISNSIGCVAPLSLASAEIQGSSGETLSVLIWQTDTGVVMTAGGGIQTISDDIKNYWDPRSADAIPADRIDDSEGDFSAELATYKLLISSGAGQTTHNVELEYSIRTNEWTKIYRENATGANPLQASFQVVSTNGKTYNYGATDEGYVFRLENGANWAGTPIEQYVHTKEILLDDEQPFFRSTTVRYFRLSFEDKDSAVDLSHLIIATGGDYIVDEDDDRIIISYGEQIVATHYCNQTATEATDAYQHVVSSIDLGSGPWNTQDVVLGPCISHSFKLLANITSLTDGMELTGMGFYYDADRKITID